MAPTSPALATADELVALLGAGPTLRAEAVRAGITLGRLRTAVSAGTLLVPHRGVLLPATTWAHAEDRRSRHILRIGSALLVAPPGAMAAQESAGVVHRLQLPSARELEVVHLVVPGEPDRERDGIRIHESSVRLAARTTVEGVPATDLPRTAVDLARGRSLAAALIALDSALRLLVARQVGDGPALREAVHDDALVEPARAVLRVALAELYGWPGTVIAREAIEWADPAAESAHESRSRGWFIRAGLPAAQIGARVLGADGRWYWVDFLWDELGVVGEADGWGKYGVGEDAVAAFRAEKHRQDAIEATGRRFVRWTTEEPERAVVARVSRALGARVPARNVASRAV